jgi:hypothetical protein
VAPWWPLKKNQKRELTSSHEMGTMVAFRKKIKRGKSRNYMQLVVAIEVVRHKSYKSIFLW